MASRKEATTVKLNQVTEDVLKVIDSYGFKQEGAYNLRLNGMAEITFSGVVAGKAGKDVLYVTERAVFALKADGIHLIEVAPGIDVQTQVLDEMDFEPIVDRDADGNVKLMDARIFKDEVMGMTIE